LMIPPKNSRVAKTCPYVSLVSRRQTVDHTSTRWVFMMPSPTGMIKKHIDFHMAEMFQYSARFTAAIIRALNVTEKVYLLAAQRRIIPNSRYN
jgi:hypothetical protein